jgi:hypothetical protein
VNLRTRAVDFVVDRDELLSVLQRNLRDVPHESRFSWLYVNNPAGPAHSWFLCDDRGSAVGIASLIPRMVWIGQTSAACGQVADFGVDVPFRSLGPAIKLQRCTFEPVLQGELAFCYDCPPHDLGMAMFDRLGLKETCRMQGYVKLLRADRQLERLLGNSAGRLASAVTNPLLRLRSSRSTASDRIDFNSYKDDFTDEFSRLDLAMRSDDTVRNRRSAEDLNWRFRHNPLQHFEVITARAQGDLLGYLIYSVSEDDAYVFDLFARNLSEIGPELLNALTSILQGRPVQTIRAQLPKGSPSVSVFVNAGFSLRGDGARIVAFSQSGGRLVQSTQWQFQHSDLMA